ncbi:putative hydrogenase nickel insertion protein HypA [Magnetofaba australis IT-1]|uniref:Putative hydrogenase nickel insertion protein HypA n=1 Tax=Magnetofaba australis IT-1 TaxID=1434232 RepID=A0A1Y2K9Y2_9PROT|nr:putative hydrogenase nickel insertion protein HypA [Magnetofaba australis IT-1]
MIQLLEEHAESQGFKRVKTVWLEIGKLSGVEVEAMRFCFDAVARDSIADGAKLEIIEPPGVAWCMTCSKQVETQQRFDPCPECGGFQLQVVSGDAMRVKELEVE